MKKIFGIGIARTALVPDGYAGGGEAVRPSPSDAEAHLNQGNVYYDKRDYDSAIAEYGEAIRLNPNYADAYNNRANAYFGKGDIDKAIGDYTEAIRLNPNYASAYSNRGNAYFNKRDYDRAIAEYGEAVRLNPNYATAYYNRGNAYFNKRDYDRAIAEYGETVRLNPNYATAYYNRGNAYKNKGDFARARADWEKVLQINPNDDGARNNLEALRKSMEAAATCKICQKKENLYGDLISGFNVEMHQTHSETAGDTTTNYHSIDKVEPVQFRICRDCLSKKARKDFGGFILFLLLSAVFLMAGMASAPVIGSVPSLIVLAIGGIVLFFSLPPLITRIIAGSKKRNSFYIWELALPIRSPGFIEEIQKTKKIDYDNDRELIGSKAGRWVTKRGFQGVAIVITLAALLYWSNAVPVISKAKPVDDSVNPAYLYVQNNLTLVSFDGQKIKRKAGFRSKAAEVNVPEGEHTLVFDYKSVSSKGDTTTTTTAKGFEFTTSFESGQYYFVNHQITEDSKIRVYLRPTVEGVYSDPGER